MSGIQSSANSMPTSIIEYINCKPDCTLWRKDYCRITAFAMEPNKLPFQNGIVGFDKKFSMNIQRAADLLEHMTIYLCVDKFGNADALTAGQGKAVDNTDGAAGTSPVLVDHFALLYFKSLQLKIGTATIDEMDPFTNLAWLTHNTKGKMNTVSTMLGGRPAAYYPVNATSDAGWVMERQQRALKPQVFWVPLCFWFSGTTELSLPIVSMMYNDIILNVTSEKWSNLYLTYSVPLTTYVTNKTGATGTGASGVITSLPTLQPQVAVAEPKILDCYGILNYVYLDVVERRLFGRNINEYLMEAHQIGTPFVPTAGSNQPQSIPLYLNYPTVNLTFYAVTDADSEKFKFVSGYGFDGNESFDTVGLKIHGQAKFELLPAGFYRAVVNQRHAEGANGDFKLYTMTFATNLSDNFQPSGTLNFGHTDNAHLIVCWDKTSPGGAGAPAGSTVYHFARYKNVFRTQLGVAGAKFGNVN